MLLMDLSTSIKLQLGVGEYVIAPEKSGTADEPLFTITPNVVLVNEASPQALADATLTLALDPILRHQLGTNGFLSIRKHFTRERQMRQYEDLYTELVFPS
mgnify:CR=1 FL=1